MFPIRLVLNRGRRTNRWGGGALIRAAASDQPVRINSKLNGLQEQNLDNDRRGCWI